MTLWEAKKNATDSYTTMKTPSSYTINWEDLDKNSYRSITTGNLIRTPVSMKWFSGSFTFNYLTNAEAQQILDMINTYPLYIRIKSPLFGNDGMLECEAYVSKASIEMLKNDNDNPQWVGLKFNIIQSKKVSGQ